MGFVFFRSSSSLRFRRDDPLGCGAWTPQRERCFEPSLNCSWFGTTRRSRSLTRLVGFETTRGLLPWAQHTEANRTPTKLGATRSNRRLSTTVHSRGITPKQAALPT